MSSVVMFVCSTQVRRETLGLIGVCAQELCCSACVLPLLTHQPSYLSLRSYPTNHHIKHNRPLNNMMDVTFVLEESGVTATVEVPCEANVAAAKEVACTALAVSPASVEMRIGTQVLEGTCRLQDTAFGAGVQVVLTRPRFADIKCPAEYDTQGTLQNFSLSPCGTLCLVVVAVDARIACVGFDTETFNTAFEFDFGRNCLGAPAILTAISQCKTLCYVACVDHLLELALPGWGGAPQSYKTLDSSVCPRWCCCLAGIDGVSVYDEDLTLLRSLSHEGCRSIYGAAVSDCGGWVITSSEKNTRLWDVNTGEAVACVESMPPRAWELKLALSRSASVFAVGCNQEVQLYHWSGAALGNIKKPSRKYLLDGVQFTPCGKYVIVDFRKASRSEDETFLLQQYDLATMSCVSVIRKCWSEFVISPCSRVVMYESGESAALVTRHLYPLLQASRKRRRK